MLTATQKKTAQAIINIFETGAVTGDYGSVTVIEGDTGRLTFGRSQTTLGSGNLADLLDRYCSNPGARFAAKLLPFMARIAKQHASLDTDNHLHNILRATADDAVMRETQDVFFDDVYWKPAKRAATQLGAVTPLGFAVVYDSKVHGSWEKIRDRTTTVAGALQTIGEQAWIAAYVKERRSWLATHKRKDLRVTVYRLDAFKRLIDQGQWGLELPLVVRGAEISSATLSATPSACFDGPQPGGRPLGLQAPLARGLDVRLLQLGLSAAGADIKADGVFGKATAEQARRYQAANGLPATGIADIALIAVLTS